MRTNADAEREMWKLVEETLKRFPEEEMEVVEGWFPDPMGVSFKRIVAECPAHLEARYEEQDGARRIFVRKRFGTSPIVGHFHDLRYQLAEEDMRKLMETAKQVQQEFNDRTLRELTEGWEKARDDERK